MANEPQITVHPAAAIFPLMSDEELGELADSIKKHGLREKIHAYSVVGEGVTNWTVVDGRNRLEALRRYLQMKDADIIADYIQPVGLGSADEEFITIKAGPTSYTVPVADYVMMANIERRNLTQQQRRDLAGKLAVMIQAAQANRPKAERIDATAEAAKKAGVSRRTAATAAQEVKKSQTKKPEVKGTTTPAATTTTAKKETAPNASVIIGRLELTTDALKKSQAMHKWEDEQVQRVMKCAKDVFDLAKLEKERRTFELRKKLEELQAQAGNAESSDEDELAELA